MRVNTFTDMPDFTNAACAGTDPESFFPDSGESLVVVKKVCAGCPERLPCLKYGLENLVDGVWGGVARRPREQMRAKLGITAHPVKLLRLPGDFPVVS